MWLIPLVILVFLRSIDVFKITVDADHVLGRYFEGIGAISGGGATTKLLASYKGNVIREILNILFEPNYAASLQILKVEIGGDGQSTEGTEASHMHTKTDLDCTRGYEGWLMQLVKQINPEVKFCALPWSFPGWVSSSENPFELPEVTANYVCKWIECMNHTYNVSIDYIGIWNERPYSVEYIKTLRRSLNDYGFTRTKIIAADGDWKIVDDMTDDNELYRIVDVVGVHYPGTNSTKLAQNMNKSIWSSEDYSTFNSDIGSGCWARIINQNYVNGLITSTIAWNLVASYFDGFPFQKCSLMTANEPWSDYYIVNGPVWITAHTTQFTKRGWRYLSHKSGVGMLPNGGSYVSYISPDYQDFTMVVETMTHNHSECIRPSLPNYNVAPQVVTFSFTGKRLSRIRALNIWMTELHFDLIKSEYFVYLGEQKLINNSITLFLKVDQLITLSTISHIGKRVRLPATKSTPLPLPYQDSFAVKSPFNLSEPQYLTPQVGYFEIVKSQVSSTSYVLQQILIEKPVEWCPTGTSPITLMGDLSTWKNMQVSVSGYIPSINGTQSLLIAGRVSDGGCSILQASGIFVWLDFSNQVARITSDMLGNRVLSTKSVKVRKDTWYRMGLVMKDEKINFYLNDKLLLKSISSGITNPGFVGFGCGSFGYAYYLNFTVGLSLQK